MLGEGPGAALGEFQGAEEALAMAVVTNFLASSEPGGRKWVKGVPLTGVVVGILGIRELVVFAFGWTEELGGRMSEQWLLSHSMR